MSQSFSRILYFSSTIADTFSPQCYPGQRTLSENRVMASSLATLGFGCILLIHILAIPPYRVIGTSTPNPSEGSLSSYPPGKINSIVTPNVNLKINISNPTPNWAIECNLEITPPGWVVPPETTRIENPTDCRKAIFRVTRGGNPREFQVWTSRVDWSYGSCVVSFDPGWLYARVRFARIDVAEIAQEIWLKCVTQEHDFMGGWAAVGGNFIVLLTGSKTSVLQPSDANSGSSES